MAEVVEHALIVDLARDTVRRTAPQEMPIFRATCDAYFTDPDKALKGERSEDELLGFGSGEVVVLVTPVILALTQEVVTFAVAEIAKSVDEQRSGLVQDLVKHLFKQYRSAPAPSAAPAALTADQLERVRRIAYQKAAALSLPEGQARVLADAVVGGLVGSD